MLYSPRRTMRRVLDSPPYRGVIPLVLAALFSSSLAGDDWREFPEAARVMSPWMTLAVCAVVLILVPLLAIALFRLIAWIALQAGRWLEGSASAAQIRAALAWGFAPTIVALLYRIPGLLFWTEAYGASRGRSTVTTSAGESALTIGMPALPESLGMILIFGALDLLFLFWYFVVASRALGEAQGFSSWRGLANLLLAMVLPFVAVVIVVLAAWLTGAT